MKKLKLTNIERMSQTEMENVKGGKKNPIPYIYHKKPLVGDDRCWCSGFCGDTTAGRKQEGQHHSKMKSHK